MKKPYLASDGRDNTLLSLYVQPKASQNKISGIHGDAVKLCLTAPPVDGKANKAVVRFLAHLFHIPKNSVVIKSGEQSRNKRILLAGLSPEQVDTLLLPFIKT